MNRLILYDTVLVKTTRCVLHPHFTAQAVRSSTQVCLLLSRARVREFHDFPQERLLQHGRHQEPDLACQTCLNFSLLSFDCSKYTLILPLTPQTDEETSRCRSSGPISPSLGCQAAYSPSLALFSGSNLTCCTYSEFMFHGFAYIYAYTQARMFALISQQSTSNINNNHVFCVLCHSVLQLSSFHFTFRRSLQEVYGVRREKGMFG